MIPIPKFSSCSDKGYDFSVGRFNRFIFVGRPMIAFVNGGVPPYTWSITGSAFSLANVSTTSQFNRIVTNSNTVVGESAEEVTVSDACGREASFTVSCCSRYLCCDQQTVVFSVDPVDYIPTGNVILNVYGGCPPFSWIVTSGDATFATPWTELRQNTLIFGDIAEAIGVQYEVIDICGSVATGFVYEEYPVYNMVAWGDNDDNELNVGYTSFTPIPFSAPVIGGPWEWAIPGGFGKKADGTFWFWGKNTYGRLGTGLAKTITYTTPQPLVSPLPGVNISKMHMHVDNSFMLLDGGYLYGTGRNFFANLGLGHTGEVNGWTAIPGVWRDVFSTRTATTLITNGGDLYLAGSTSAGVGPPPYSNHGIYSVDYMLTPTIKGASGLGGHNAKSVAQTTCASCYIDMFGRLFFVGRQSGTFCFSGSTVNKVDYVDLTPAGLTVFGLDWRAGILMGSQISCFLGGDGTLWTGGYNVNGNLLGTPHPQVTPRQHTFEQVGTVNEWTEIYMSDGGTALTTHVFLKKLDGTWWGFGSASSMLPGTSGDVYEPTYLPALDGIEKLWIDSDNIIGGYRA